MKRIFRLLVLAGGIVVAAVLASSAPTTRSRVYAQVMMDGAGRPMIMPLTAFYNPYGQGPYGGYGQGYAASSRANRNMFQSHGGMFGNRAYGYSGYGNVPSGYGYRYDYGIGPQVRVYGRSSYYQPSYGRVYVPFGYSEY